MTNELRRRIRKLEENDQAQNGREIIFLWGKTDKEEQEILSKLRPTDKQVIIYSFSWQGETAPDRTVGPIDPVPWTPDSRPGVPPTPIPARIPPEHRTVSVLPSMPNSLAHIRQEIEETCEQLEEEGLSPGEIAEMVGQDDLVALMGRRKRFDIGQA